MDLAFTAGERALRAECRAWLEAHVPTAPLPSQDTEEGFWRHVGWERELFGAGWAVVSWPRAFGGRDASLVAWCVFEEEYYRARAPSRVTQNGIFLLAPTLYEFGTAAQQERILRPMAAGEVLWAQAWSEPGSGSDLASVRSTARRVEGGWRLSGQKTWCTRGMWCHGAYGLFRTDPHASRHRGLTYFLFPLDAPGVTRRPVQKLDGDTGFAEVFLEDVFVPDDDVIGPVNDGWRVAMATTSSERGLSLRSPGRFLATATRLVELWRDRRHAADPALRDRVVQAWVEAQAYRWATYGTVTRMAEGGHVGADSSLTKVFWSEHDLATHETALALLGAEAERSPEAEPWVKGHLFALAGPIYAGTNEIQRNIVAERVLDLPRATARRKA